MSTLKTKLKNLLSRKFLVAVGGVVTGIVTILQGETVTGASLIAISVISYLVAEGYIDAKSAASAASAVAEVANEISSATSSAADDVAADIVSNISKELDSANGSTEAVTSSDD
jgi:energy-converting hydrogenase Eha subunit C